MVTPRRLFLFCIFMLIGQGHTLTERKHIYLSNDVSYIRKLSVADGSSADEATVNRKINAENERSPSHKYRFLSWLGILKLPDLSDEDGGSSFSPPGLIAILPSTGGDEATNQTQTDSLPDNNSASLSSSSSSLASDSNPTSSNSSSVSTGATSFVTGSEEQSSLSTEYDVNPDSSLPQDDSAQSSSSSEGNESSSDEVNLNAKSSSPKHNSQILKSKGNQSSSTVIVLGVLVAIVSVGFLGAVANPDARERLLKTAGIVNGRWKRNGNNVNLLYAASGSWLPNLDEPITSIGTNNTANTLIEDNLAHDVAKTNWRHIVDENINIFSSRANNSSRNDPCLPVVCPTLSSKGSDSKATTDHWKSIGSVQLMTSSTNDAWKSVGSVQLQQSSSSTQNSSSTGSQSQISLDALISSAVAAPSPWKNKGKPTVLPSPTGSNVTDCVSDHDNTEAFVRFRNILSTLVQPTTVEEGDDEDSCRNYALA